MLHLDGVIYRLQQSGGISVLFDEIITRLPRESFILDIPRLSYPWSRYLNADFKTPKSIFHSTYYRLPAGKAAGVVTTVHDFTYERYARGAKKSLHSWQKNRAIAGSDVVICVSESTRADLNEYVRLSSSQKVVVIPNGVSDSYRYLALPTHEQVLFVGARNGYKNFKNAVLALKKFPDITLVCVGGGAFSSIERELLERNISGRYKHAGRVTNEALNELYNKSVCLLYPSLYEGFGIPVLEAMKAGCPVIAVCSSSIPEVAGDAALLLERGEVEEIVDAIELLTSNVSRQYFRIRGFAQAGKFSWNFTFEKTLKIYEGLLGQKL